MLQVINAASVDAGRFFMELIVKFLSISFSICTETLCSSSTQMHCIYH